MPGLRRRSEYWGDKAWYWEQYADRARKRAQEMLQRAQCTAHYLTKQRMLKLAKRYDQMAHVAETRVNKQRRCTEFSSAPVLTPGKS